MKRMMGLSLVLSAILLLTGCGKLTKINELVNQGNEAYKNGDYQAAAEAYTQVLDLDAKRELVYNNRGMAYYNLGLYEKAIADFSSALALDEKSADTFGNRALAYQKIGKNAEAEADFTKALQREETADYYVGRAEVRKAQGKLQEAEADYSAALALAPSDEAALNGRGLLYFQTGHYAAAIQDYTQALQLPELSTADKATLYWNRAESHNQAEAYEAAAADYIAYLKTVGTEESRALKKLAFCQEAEGLYAEAADTLTRLLAVEPADTEARRSRAQDYYQLADYEKAAEDYTAVLDAAEDYLSYALRGYCYYQLGDAKQAIADLTASIELNGNYAWAYYIRGTVYRSQEDYKAAQADLEKAIALENQAIE